MKKNEQLNELFVGFAHIFTNFDDAIYPNDPQNERDSYQCNVCGKDIYTEGICNSKACIEADEM